MKIPAICLASLGNMWQHAAMRQYLHKNLRSTPRENGQTDLSALTPIKLGTSQAAQAQAFVYAPISCGSSLIIMF